mmetsp:Transcript_33699/g.77004  ORF Transcript_33699/g.77004 Transcript_33699/m.77004 type:complete len:120 (+) Transcript_33699:61-420(+)
MPSLVVNTNVDLGSEDDKKKIMYQLTEAVAKGLGKPDSYVAIQLCDKQSMMWGGSSEPLALCTCTSLGAINLQNNKAVVEQVCKALGEAPHSIKPNRIYVTFHDIPRENMGYDGSTFAG